MMRIRTRSGAFTNAGACTTFGSGETEDFTINIVVPSGCTGTPVGGSTDVLPVSPVCTGSMVNLTVSGATAGVAGLSYQWQSSGDNISFNNIPGANNEIYSTVVNANMYYRRIITCANGGATANATSVNVTINAAGVVPYVQDFESLATVGAGLMPGCWKAVLQSGTNFTSANAPIRNGIGAHGASNYVWSRWSSNAWLVSEGIQLTAGQLYHFDYYYQPTDAIAGFTIKNFVSSSNDTASLSAGTLLGTIVDPIDNTGFAHIVYSYTPATTGVYYFAVKSECPGSAPWYLCFDDFSVNAISGCTGTPAAGIAEGSKDSVCTGNNTVIFSVSGTVPTSGLTYQWQSSTNGTAFTNMIGRVSDTLKISNSTVLMHYRRVTTCTNSGLSATSTSDSLEIKPSYLCYCSPDNGISLHSATGPSIENVEIPTTTLNISNAGVSTNGYTQTITPAGDVTQALSYDINVTTSAAPSTAGAWIEWNHNNLFDASEFYSMTITATTSTVNFSVPVTAMLGQTALRVRVRSAGFLAADACASFGSGETEDFMLNVLPGAGCTGTPVGGTTEISPAPPVCPSGKFTLKVSGATSGVTGLTYQWQSSPNNITFTNIAGATLDSLVTSVSTDTYFRRIITCTTSSQTATSISVLANVMTAASAPYTQDFESLATVGNSIAPQCWSVVTQNGTNFTSANAPVRNTIGSNGGSNYMWSRWSSITWLISEGINMTAGKTYSIQYNYRPTDAITGFTLKTFIAKGADTTILRNGTLLGTVVNPIDNTQYTAVAYTFVAPTTGVYNFAIKSECPSASPWYMCFDDFKADEVLPIK
jgi:hypothetical protein